LKLLHALAAVSALLATGTLARDALSTERSEMGAAVRSTEIRVGDTLQAVRDVSLDEAIVAEGSKVQVSGRRLTKAGVLVDVALADGHVVKGLALPEVQKNFRRVEN
jgi:hypothetical protein